MRSWRLDGVGRSILKVGNTVYVGGSFTQAISPDGTQRVARRNLAAFDATTGTLIPSFRADADNAVHDMEIDGDTLYLGGVFTSIGGVSRARLAAVDATTGAVRTGFRSDTNGKVNNLSLAAGKLYVGGSFTTIGGQSHSRAAAVSPATGAVDARFVPSIDGSVHAIAATPDGSTVYIGGPYDNVNGRADTDISTLDGATGATVGPELTDVVGYVDDLEVTADGRSLLAAHSGVPGVGNRTSVFDTATGTRTWRQSVDGDVQGVDLVGDHVFSGFHDGSKGDGATRVALYDRSTGAEDATFRPSFDRFMGAWAVDGDGDALVIAGNFSTISGTRAEGFAIFPRAAPTTFAASVWGYEPWSYLDTGIEPASAWRRTGYDDATWKRGIGEFGYGDGDERTRISAGPSASNKHLTSWFRREFDATTAPTSAGIYLRVDDGAVVYVNGVEAGRDNMPAGAVTASTLAFARDGYGEDEVRYLPIDPILIGPGRNTIAVEVHQTSAASDDLTFFATFVAYGAATPTTSTTTTSTTTTSTTTTSTTTTSTTTTSTTTTSTTSPPTTTTAAPPPVGVEVTAEAMWAYLDDGTDQANAWTAVGFDDTTWKRGVGEFGYGDGDERTVVGYGPTASRKYTTTYFRHAFAASGAPDDLTLRLRIDDGAVAYLNGVEIARFNLPTGPVTHLTRAPDAISGPGERLDRAVGVDPTLIRAGTNVLAVEVHQNTPGSTDLSFLATIRGAGAATTPATTTTTVPATTATTTTTPPTTTTTPPTTTPPTTTTTTVLAPPPSGSAALIAPDAVWAYLDDGSDQGSAWTALDFDDAAWTRGVGEFGYGDGDERTVVGYGPSASRKYPATYFRHRFSAAGTPDELMLTLRIDDGAVVHINGVEAHRFNMPSTGVDHQTRALDAIWGSAERLDRAITLDPALIVAGSNVLTVQVHQDTSGSSDVTFLASLTGRF
jgi:hypothetical protein